MLELQIISPQEDGFVQEIRWNKEEIVQAVNQMMADYNNLIYTEETMKDAKADRAKLNKLLEAFENERKRVRKLCETPYKKFEADVKEVTDLIRRPIGMIDAQIKEMEEAKKAEKRDKIMDYYEAHIGALRGILPFHKVLRPEYLNASKSMKSIESEVEGLISRVNSDMDTIEGIKTKYEFQVKDVYIRTLDLSQALQENSRLEEVARKLEERHREEATAREQAEKEEKPVSLGMISAEIPVALKEDAGQPAQVAEVFPVEKQYVVELRVHGTKEELTTFQTFLQKNRIRYDVTKKAREE